MSGPTLNAPVPKPRNMGQVASEDFESKWGIPFDRARQIARSAEFELVEKLLQHRYAMHIEAMVGENNPQITPFFQGAARELNFLLDLRHDVDGVISVQQKASTTTII